MASLDDFVNDSSVSGDNNSPNSVKSHLFSLSINDRVTDFVLIKYSDRIFIAVTENRKIGNLYTIHTNCPQRNGFNPQVPIVFDIKCILGADSEEKTIAVRALVEKLGINQPILLSLTLTAFDYETIATIAENILANKCW